VTIIQQPKVHCFNLAQYYELGYSISGPNCSRASSQTGGRTLCLSLWCFGETASFQQLYFH
jgi:hypothetical protein